MLDFSRRHFTAGCKKETGVIERVGGGGVGGREGEWGRGRSKLGWIERRVIMGTPRGNLREIRKEKMKGLRITLDSVNEKCFGIFKKS